MVYPKHQALPRSPRKKAKTSSAAASPRGKTLAHLQRLPVQSPLPTAPKHVKYSASDALVLSDVWYQDAIGALQPVTSTAPSNTPPFQTGAIGLICEMLGNYNKMIALNNAAMKKMEKATANHRVMVNANVEVLLHQAKSFEERLQALGAHMKANADDSLKMARLGVSFLDTAHSLEQRLKSLEGRVSSIERLLVRSSRKRKADQIRRVTE